MKKYVTESCRWDVTAKIREVEVERETESSVWINGQRRNKTGGYDIFHDTWESAHAHLLGEAERHALAARRRLEFANGVLGNVKGMKRP